MKLLNQSLQYLSIAILLVVTPWAGIFYFNLLDEIYDSIDDGLDNSKMLVIQKAHQDNSILGHGRFEEGNYAINEITKARALATKDTHRDSLMYMPYEEDLEPVRMLTTAFELHGRYYELKIINSMVEEDDLIEDLFWSIVWLYILLLASILLVNNWVLKRLWKPFYELLRQLKAFRLDGKSQAVDIKTNTSEFLELKKTADALIRHAVETFERQKQFTENASHELQTPLAVITAKLELLLEQSDLTTSSAEKIAQVLSITDRLKKLNQSLLLLAKIENKQYFNNEELDLAQIAETITQEMQEIAEYKGIAIDLNHSAPCHATMDPSLATILLTNLIKNAIAHNHSQGEVQISSNEQQISVRNTGSTKALDSEKIFSRFHKGSDQSKHTGLGLAIAQAICQLYGLELVYQYEDGWHAFTIRQNPA